MDSARREAARERFEQVTALPLLILAVIMIPGLIVPLMVDLSEPVAATFDAVNWFIWAAFAAQYAIRLTLATRRWRFVRREWLDLVIILLPLLRPLRIVQSARALNALRLARLAAFTGVVDQEAKRLLTQHGLHYVLVVALALLAGSAGLVYLVESGDGSGIETFGDALWWALVTLTTVGYGDMYPLTATGRGVAAFLMLVGVAIFGAVTANVAAFFIERSSAERKDEVDRLDLILAKLSTIEAELAEMRAGATS